CTPSDTKLGIGTGEAIANRRPRRTTPWLSWCWAISGSCDMRRIIMYIDMGFLRGWERLAVPGYSEPGICQPRYDVASPPAPAGQRKGPAPIARRALKMGRDHRFLAGAFLAGAFLAGAFFAVVCLAGALAAVFLAGAFFAGAFFVGCFLGRVFL